MAEITRIYSQWGQAPEPLWREVLGSRLRALRADRDETLAQTAERAGISPQYLSEVERGRKEPSSEMIAALAGALDITVADLMADTAEDLRQIVDIQLERLERRMSERALDLEVTPAAKDWLAKAGYDPDFGARPLRRVLQRSVEDQLALALLEGRYTEGSKVVVDTEGDGLALR